MTHKNRKKLLARLTQCASVVIAGIWAAPSPVNAAPAPPCECQAPVGQYCPPGVTVTDLPGTAPTPADPGKAPATGDAKPDTATPPTADSLPATPQVAQPQSQSLSSSFGGSRGASGSTPNMIGDALGRLTIADHMFSGTNVVLPSNVFRYKAADNTSILPQDRVFYSFNHFHNAVEGVPGGAPSQNVDRHIFGLEKTFLDGLASAEIRIPIARLTAEDQGANLAFTGVDFENQFGNISLALKTLLWGDDTTSVSAGLAIVLPTGNDVVANDGVGGVRMIENDAVHLNPFIGILHNYSERLFVQSFIQFDFDTNGNTWNFQNVPGFNDFVGRVQDQNLMYISVNAGYWLWQNQSSRHIRGIAAIAEFHYTTSLNDLDSILVPPNATPLFDNRTDALNATAGLVVQVGGLSTLRIGGVMPLRTQANDRGFDGEVAVQFNRRF